MARLLLLLPLAACVLPGEHADPVGDLCPGADCQDELLIRVLDASGAEAAGIRGTFVLWPSGDEGGAVEPEEVAFDCTAEASESEGPSYCSGASSLRIHDYGPTIELWVENADATQSFSGAIEPAWVDPYGSEECGHYCWQAEETIQLQP